MGIKIVLTESQIANLEKKVGKVMVTEANMACSNLRYDSLISFLGDRNERKLGYETIAHKVRDYDTNEPNIGIRHHRTDILTVRPDSTVVVNNGGWYSRTTKDRLNQFLGCFNVYISQKRGDWFVHNRHGEQVPYQNGMEVLPDGQVFIGGENIDSFSKKKHIEKMKDLDIDPKYRELYGLSSDN